MVAIFLTSTTQLQPRLHKIISFNRIPPPPSKILHLFVLYGMFVFTTNSLIVKLPIIWIRTMRKQAPIITAFIRTARSSGNEIPKLSASVKNSRAKPLQCFEILPTTASLFRDRTCNYHTYCHELE